LAQKKRRLAMKPKLLIFSSATFTQLANPSTHFYLQLWQEIYEMLKKELAK
jgi:hypothetical protein